MTSRAQRNNNPGNIDRGAHWRGLMLPENMTPAQEAEHRFCVFVSPQMGFRALALLLLNYEADGFQTIDAIIHRWAPNNENNTTAYIQFVAAHTMFPVLATLDLRNYETMRKLAAAIANREAGDVWWSNTDLDGGLGFAGLRLPPGVA